MSPEQPAKATKSQDPAAAAESASPEVPQDASNKQVLYYAIGNIEGGLANQFFNILNTVGVVVLAMNPIILGAILTLKTIMDAITDPIMAQITDNANTRYGRRIPFILGGGLTRVLFLVAVFVFFPTDSSIKSNAELQREQEVVSEIKADKREQDAANNARAEEAGYETAVEVIPESEELTQEPDADVVPTTAPEAKAHWTRGLVMIFTDTSDYHRKVAIYLLVATILFAILTTVQSVPYYALGIELCPSYDGRTRVVMYRSFADKAMSLVAPWIMPFIFLPIFVTAMDGLVWYSIIVCVVGIPTTIAMCMVIKERPYDSGHKRPPAPPLLRSMWLTAKNIHFLKILFLYVFIGFTNGVFATIGTFLVLYWVFGGDILKGSIIQGYAATIAVILGFLSLPLINWASKRFGKHRALQAAIVWMSIGTALNWVLWNPNYPYLMLLLPFFHSVGIASVFTILPSLMADVTDIDEINTGVRREGMFGAVMAFLMKAIGSAQPLLAGVILVISGFDASLGEEQLPGVFTNMRIMASLIPAGLLLFALIALIRYPLTRERMEEVKAILADRARERQEAVARSQAGH